MVTNNNLGKIKKIDLRKGWNHEASDFTNWLAEQDNLRLLGDEIGVDISLIQTEAIVGRYNADILAEEENTGRKIIIENQLEATNHDHLGKVITYASGFDANIVIWIVRESREEHRQAIDWLNEHTDDELSFFLVKLELWQIGDSPYAPKFEIISKPNDWAKTVKKSSTKEISETKARQMQFWEQFKVYAQAHKTTLHLGRTPRPQHWFNINVGSRYAHIALSMSSFDEVIRVELYIPDNKELYKFLEKHKEQIEKELGFNIKWQELPGKKASSMKVETKGLIDNSGEWEDYFAWLQKCAEHFLRVFSKYLKKYK